MNPAGEGRLSLGFQQCDPRLAGSAGPGNMLEMQILGPRPKHTESLLWGWDSAVGVLVDLPRVHMHTKFEVQWPKKRKWSPKERKLKEGELPMRSNPTYCRVMDSFECLLRESGATATGGYSTPTLTHDLEIFIESHLRARPFAESWEGKNIKEDMSLLLRSSPSFVNEKQAFFSACDGR